MAAEQESVQSPNNGGSGRVGGASPAVVTSSPQFPTYEIMIEVTYRYEAGEEEPYQATLRVYIEVEEGTEKLPSLLRFYGASIVGSRLTANWGEIKERGGKKYRYDYYYYYASSWEELQEKIAKTISAIEGTLNEVKRKNMEAILNKPRDFVTYIRI